MPSNEANPGTNSIAGNTGAQPDANTKLGADVRNTNANSTLQPATPAMQAEPTDAPAAAEALPNPDTADFTGTQETKSPTLPQSANDPAPALDDSQPNVYGGNFGNDVQGSFQDPNRASNQRSDPNRGEFGQQEYNQGATHGGYGNQYREVDYPAPDGGTPQTAHEKYYGEGSGHPGHQHNAYRDYDGHDLVPDQQGHTVRGHACSQWSVCQHATHRWPRQHSRQPQPARPRRRSRRLPERQRRRKNRCRLRC